MSTFPSVSVARPVALATLAAGLLLTGCGRSLTDMTIEAMDLCIEARNPLFTGGRGAEALDTPLPPSAEALAKKFNYVLASEKFQEIAKEAGDQVTLVCALDLASRWNDSDARKFVARYAEHPDAAVAAAAQRLAQP
jgi:hypothetical protein